MNVALRKPSIKVVWSQWLTDCVNIWKRLDETPYLMDPTTASRTEVLTHGVVVKDKHDKHHHVEAVGGELEMGEINWDDINDEVEAAMNESDDDEEEYKGGATWDYEDDERCVALVVCRKAGTLMILRLVHRIPRVRNVRGVQHRKAIRRLVRRTRRGGRWKGLP